jgi:hypothetical protein
MGETDVNVHIRGMASQERVRLLLMQHDALHCLGTIRESPYAKREIWHDKVSYLTVV